MEEASEKGGEVLPDQNAQTEQTEQTDQSAQTDQIEQNDRSAQTDQSDQIELDVDKKGAFQSLVMIEFHRC